MIASFISKLSQLSINTYSEIKLFKIINLFIFLSLFAVSASLISLYFEQKIDNLDKEVSTINSKSNIYNYYIASITSKIKNTEILIANSDSIQSKKKLLELSDFPSKYIPEDVNSYVYVHFLNNNIEFLELALKEAIVISSSNSDLEKINNLRKKTEVIKEKIKQKREENFNWVKSDDLIELNKIQDKFEKRLLVNKILLKESKNLLMEVGTVFFLRKKNESEYILKDASLAINKYSKMESNAIWIAFFIQLTVFFVTQFFEFAFEHPIKKKRGKSQWDLRTTLKLAKKLTFYYL